VTLRSARWSGQLRPTATPWTATSTWRRGATRWWTGARLPVFAYVQDRAVLRGVEGSLEWAAGRSWVLGAMGDYLHASGRTGRRSPSCLPPRLGASLRRDDGALSLGGDVHHELRQDRVGAADEPPTPRAHPGPPARRPPP
jgi:hypothetical protein